MSGLTYSVRMVYNDDFSEGKLDLLSHQMVYQAKTVYFECKLGSYYSDSLLVRMMKFRYYVTWEKQCSHKSLVRGIMMAAIMTSWFKRIYRYCSLFAVSPV